MTVMDKTDMIKARPASITLCTEYIFILNTYSPSEAVNPSLITHHCKVIVRSVAALLASVP